MDKDAVYVLIGSLGSILWAVVSWSVVRVVKRADNHSKKLDEVESRITAMEHTLPGLSEAIKIRQENLEKNLERIENILLEGRQEHKDLKDQITKYIIETAQEKNVLLEKILTKLT